jgi:uncharacterized membrane protein
MRIQNNKRKGLFTATTLLAVAFSLPCVALSQTAHERAEHAQTRSDHRHHTAAKVIGGSAAGGAVIGALAGGGKGALIGGAIGAGGGVVANHVRKQHDVRKREETGRY